MQSWMRRLAQIVGRGVCLAGCLAGCLCAGVAHADALVNPERARVLVRMVRQDCGSCHGMRLTGGLGPALTPTALQHIPLSSLSATIFHGRPGTPMPPWRAMIDANEAQWIAQQLLAGFPTEEGQRP